MQNEPLSYTEWKKVLEAEHDESFGPLPSEDELRKMWWREEGQFRKVRKGLGSH